MMHDERDDYVDDFLPIKMMIDRRVSEPHEDVEVDAWVKDRGPFPALGFRRLPLHGLVSSTVKDKYKLLEKEFNLETYRSWVQVTDHIDD